MRGVLARAWTRSAREPTRATLPQSSRDYGRRGPSAQLLKRLEGAAHQLFVVGVRECERGLIRAAELRPEVGSAPPVTRDRGGVRLRRVGGDVLLDAGAPAPVGELADGPAVAGALGERKRGIGGLGRELVTAFQP